MIDNKPRERGRKHTRRRPLQATSVSIPTARTRSIYSPTASVIATLGRLTKSRSAHARLSGMSIFVTTSSLVPTRISSAYPRSQRRRDKHDNAPQDIYDDSNQSFLQEKDRITDDFPVEDNDPVVESDSGQDFGQDGSTLDLRRRETGLGSSSRSLIELATNFEKRDSMRSRGADDDDLLPFQWRSISPRTSSSCFNRSMTSRERGAAKLLYLHKIYGRERTRQRVNLKSISPAKASPTRSPMLGGKKMAFGRAKKQSLGDAKNGQVLEPPCSADPELPG